jgi:hypothetical protein
MRSRRPKESQVRVTQPCGVRYPSVDPGLGGRRPSRPLRYRNYDKAHDGFGKNGLFAQQLFSALTDAGYRGAVCIEVEDRAYEGSLEDRRRALRQSKRFLEQWVTD